MKNRDEVSSTKYIVHGNDVGYLAANIGINGVLYSPHASVFVGLCTNQFEVIHKRTKMESVDVIEGEEQTQACDAQSTKSMFAVI